MNKNVSKYVWVLLGFILIIVGCIESYLINSTTSLGILILVLLIVNGIIGYILKKEETLLMTITLASSGLGILFEIIWLSTKWYPAFVFAQVITIAIGFYCFYEAKRFSKRLKDNNHHSASVKIIFRVIQFAGIVIAGLLAILMITTSITPVPVVKFFQAQNGVENSFKSLAVSTNKVINNKYVLTNDIQYGTEYPRSYLDIYTLNNDQSVHRPTYFYVHGGGFILGDKQMGDPNAKSDSSNFYFEDMLNAGYNVVAINYAFAPQYTFPTPVIQLSQAVDFMTKNAEKYGIDMSQVVFGGGSAGGNIVGNFANIQTNSAYAKQVGIDPVINREYIKAVVFDSAALDSARGGKTQIPVSSADFQFYQAMRVYFKKDTLIGNNYEKAKLGNVINYVTDQFPPAFIADGNTGTFPDQAEDLSKKLNELNVANYLDLYDINKVSLGHGFMASESASTTDYTNKKIDFLKDFLK